MTPRKWADADDWQVYGVRHYGRPPGWRWVPVVAFAVGMVLMAVRWW